MMCMWCSVYVSVVCGVCECRVYVSVLCDVYVVYGSVVCMWCGVSVSVVCDVYGVCE